MSDRTIKYDKISLQKDLSACISKIATQLDADTHCKLITSELPIENLPAFLKKIKEIKTERASEMDVQLKEKYLKNQHDLDAAEELSDEKAYADAKNQSDRLNAQIRELLDPNNSSSAKTDEDSLSAEQLIASTSEYNAKLHNLKQELKKIEDSLASFAEKASKRLARKNATDIKNQLSQDLYPQYLDESDKEKAQFETVLQDVIQRDSYEKYLLAVKDWALNSSEYKDRFNEAYPVLLELNKIKQQKFDLDKKIANHSEQLEKERKILESLENWLKLEESDLIKAHWEDSIQWGFPWMLIYIAVMGISTVVPILLSIFISGIFIPLSLPITILIMGVFFIPNLIRIQRRLAQGLNDSSPEWEHVKNDSDFQSELKELKISKDVEVQNTKVTTLEEELTALNKASAQLQDQVPSLIDEAMHKLGLPKLEDSQVGNKKYHTPYVQQEGMVYEKPVPEDVKNPASNRKGQLIEGREYSKPTELPDGEQIASKQPGNDHPTDKNIVYNNPSSSSSVFFKPDDTPNKKPSEPPSYTKLDVD